MFLLKDLLLFSYLTVLIAGAAVELPTKTGWPNSASKSAYSRALGPPGGLDTITVPYMPKSPFFPKFVDPKTMISKKTDLLSNLFGGLGPVYPMGFKPFLPYAASGPSSYSAADEAQLLNALGKSSPEEGPYKRGIFGPPFGAKPFGPMSPMSPMSPKFGPMSKFSSYNTVPDYSAVNDFSRKRRSVDESPVAKLRSIMDDSQPKTKNLGPPPPYPTLAPISEEPEEEVNTLFNKMGAPTAPKQYLPGMFGPFGPMVDPSMFIAKKSAFLDALFKNLATSTAAPPTEAPTTDATTAKSTIVPPDFWFPTSMIPSPSEYNDKVGEFLDKLFESLKLNKTAPASESGEYKSDFARSLKLEDEAAQSKIARSIEDVSSINAAKDTIVDTILSELGDLKGNMVTTMNDLITYENSAASMSAKKPFKSFGPGMWPKSGSPSGMLPFQQKMAVLSRVFDMLTDLQKNITLAIQNVVNAKMSSVNPASPNPFAANAFPAANSLNMSLLDALKRKLDMLDYGMPMSYNPGFSQFDSKVARSSPKGPSSFWVSYPQDAAGMKRQVDSDTESLLSKDSDSEKKQQARSVKMQMHQGYQSLPAGAIESVQAGGGSVPGHQGGGIKLFEANNYEDLDQWANWMEYLKNDYRGGHRHHNHH